MLAICIRQLRRHGCYLTSIALYWISSSCICCSRYFPEHESDMWPQSMHETCGSLYREFASCLQLFSDWWHAHYSCYQCHGSREVCGKVTILILDVDITTHELGISVNIDFYLTRKKKLGTYFRMPTIKYADLKVAMNIFSFWLSRARIQTKCLIISVPTSKNTRRIPVTNIIYF